MESYLSVNPQLYGYQVEVRMENNCERSGVGDLAAAYLTLGMSYSDMISGRIASQTLFWRFRDLESAIDFADLVLNKNLSNSTSIKKVVASAEDGKPKEGSLLAHDKRVIREFIRITGSIH